MEQESKIKIPIEFYRGVDQPIAHTVGELIDELKRLPSDLRVDSDWSKGVKICVYNINSDRPHLRFNDPSDDEDWQNEN